MSASVFEIFDFGIIIKMAISVRSNREEVSIGWSIMQVSGDTGWELVCSRCYGDQLSQIVISLFTKRAAMITTFLRDIYHIITLIVT